MKIMKLTIFINLTLAANLLSNPPDGRTKSAPYQNPALPIEVRVNDLVSRMTLDEKISQMMNAADSISRLGIPDYNWWSEGLHGVAISGIATVFPQSIGLAATWDDSLVNRVGDVISTEFRAKFNDYQKKGDHGIFKGLTVWSPNVNIFRDPRWGRGQETYGEDPYLTSRMGVAFVKGMQGSDPKYLKVVSTPKHYAVHSGPESERHHFDAVTDYRDFAETYTPAFKACITEGGAFSVMGAYQRYLATPCCASELLLKKVLREKWNFKGYVVSDCGAIYDIYGNHKFVSTPEEASALAVLAGCDLECGDTYKYLKNAVQKGLLKETDIDISVKRLFTARYKLGMFDPPETVRYAQIPISENDTPEHRELALKAARESIVLLKNENNFLPLKKDTKTIAVIGPNANVIEVLYGNYNGVSSKPVTLLDGIKNRAPASTKIIYEPGSNIADQSPILTAIPEDVFLTGHENEKGLIAEYFDNMNLEGAPFLTRIDKLVDFDFITQPPLPDENMKFSVRWTGWLVPSVTDTYFIGFLGDDGYRVYLDDTLLYANWTDHAPTLSKVKMDLSRDKKYKIRIEYYQNVGGAVAKFQWAKNNENYTQKIDDAVKQADVIIYAGGISPMLEGEEMPIDIEGFHRGDRTSLDIPAVQDNILKRIKLSGKPIVLVLLNGSPLSVQWADKNADAILETWYPGEEGGNAIADVIFGNYNPAGRLPLTFYASVLDLPPFEDYNMKGRTYRYFNGTPLYEFGYGLSYTTFMYSNIKAPSTIRTNENVHISVEVENTGKMDGDEVIELYTKILDAKVPVPIHTLQGFKRIFLTKGEKKIVEFNLKPEQFSIINDKNQRVVEPGSIQLSIGGCQPSQKALSSSDVLRTKLEVTGVVNVIE
ncbi:MAG: glycoside hydrolase family 3 C-terminal domain-containing protein [Ignavibacteriales bacterium]|nr:glycoside hydrolase family 3 C-terminal domain-containing protein [Ignavibacteriales bacterium]